MSHIFLAICRGVLAWTALLAPSFVMPDATVAQGATAQTATSTKMEKFNGVWVEGPGFDITYGRTYDACSQRCLETATCVMIEYYRPEKKCNLYSTLRPRLNGGSSTVAVRR
jgi:PAN domain